MFRPLHNPLYKLPRYVYIGNERKATFTFYHLLRFVRKILGEFSEKIRKKESHQSFHFKRAIL